MPVRPVVSFALPDQGTVFGKAAEAYDRVRPGYPVQALDTVAAVTGTAPGDRVLEVGAGTGKATVAMADRGRRLTCLEPSAEMRHRLGVSCAGRSGLSISAEFLETFPAGQRFRLIMAAQSWHWIDRAVRHQRVHKLLTPGGWLALLWNTPWCADRGLHAELDVIYQAHAPGLQAREPGASGVHRGQWSSAELTRNLLLGLVLHWRHDWVERYDAEAYARLLATQSDHLMLQPAALTALRDEVERLVTRRGGPVTLVYTTDLFLAQRAP